MSVHNSLKNFEQWINTDIKNSPKRKEALKKINTDYNLDSPTILKSIDGKYSPYRKDLSKLGNMQLDMIKIEKTINSASNVNTDNKNSKYI